MKYAYLLLFLLSGCAEFDKILGVAQVVAPPIADAVQPGLGVIVGGIIGGIAIVGGVIATLAISLKKKKP